MKQKSSKPRKEPKKSGSMTHTIINPVISIVLIVAAFFISDHVSMLNSKQTAKADLIASANQEAETLSATWEGQITTLQSLAIQLSDSYHIYVPGALEDMERLKPATSFSHITFALDDGKCYLSPTETVDVSQREYYVQAMNGLSSLQRVEDSHSGDGVLFVLAVPITKNHQVIGAVLGSYTQEVLASTLIPEIYDGKAYSLICREDGQVFIGDPESSGVTGNFFSDIEALPKDGKELAAKVKRDISTGVTGTVSYSVDGVERYAVYVPLTTTTAEGQRLVMFSFIPSSLIRSEAVPRIVLNALLFFLILFAAALTFTAYLYSARRSEKSLERQMELLKASEEQTRVAVEESGLLMARYDLRNGTYRHKNALLFSLGFGETIENVPEAFIAADLVAEESIDDFRAFYNGLREGSLSTLIARLKTPEGYCWFRKDASFICGDDGKPYEAIIRYRDITQQREREAVYSRWKQSIKERDPAEYTLFMCNLSKGASFDTVKGKLLTTYFRPDVATFNQRTREYAGRCVHQDDFEAYVELLNSEKLLADYYRGNYSAEMNYRERVSEGEYRWLHLTVELTPYPESDEVEAFLIYEKGEEPSDVSAPSEPLQTDSLTGVLNRGAFVQRVTAMFADQPAASHALILINIDGFKRINENFGHAVGDQALIDIAASIRSSVREDDPVGRLGGDEFLVCIHDISSQSVIEQKAMLIMAQLRKSFSVDITLSASLGISLYPQDGDNFNMLYHNVDLALQSARSIGPDTYVFFNSDVKKLPGDAAVAADTNRKAAEAKRKRMLVISDDSAVVELIDRLFAPWGYIEVCGTEKDAFFKVRRFGISLSVILLNINLTGSDPMKLIDRLRSVGEIANVPLILMGVPEQRGFCVEAIGHGVCDFILAPFDEALLTARVESSTARAENDRLRAQNTFLQTQSLEASGFRAAFENAGTVVVEYDWQTHVFTYDTAINEAIFGKYDDRSLWQILMTDMVADMKDVKALQELVYNLANDSSHTSYTMDVMLKTPSKSRHWFTVKAFKRVNDMNMTSKIILTFLDVNEDVLASKKLHFQAEHDSLTGLYNRITFIKVVKETVSARPGGCYMLLYCDIDDFSFFNERYGRDEGDRLLQYSGQKLMVYSDAMNGITGRLSNDVFCVLLPNNPGMLEKTTSIIHDFFGDYPLKARITGRVGVYVITDPTMTVDSMLDMAATAADTIRGKYAAWLAVYDSKMDEKKLLEKDITDRMEAALVNNEFDIYIQPQFNHATGKIVGAEALVRWIDPVRGVVSPGVFIPVFERNGFITRLDEYVWELAAKYLSEWIEGGGEPVPISVNVSREDLSDPELCSKLLAIITKYDIPIHLYRLEITETLFANDAENLISVVDQLHKAGFLIEMDDFGSGYSSLNILKDVPVDILKLDMRFFSGSDNLGRGGMIINAVLRMARWLNIPVIAEGVEQKEQADFLLSIGCPTIQGYLYEKPLPRERFEMRLRENGAIQVVSEAAIHTKLDTHDFWNPNSADSQIFNNYIGPAVIFEYHGGEFEILRMNRRFITLLSLTERVMVPARGLVHFSDESKPKLKKAVLEAIYSGEAVKSDFDVVLDNGSRPKYGVSIRLVAKSSERALLFAVLEK